MEAPSKRMRLAVVVEALAEENAHGDYRDVALASFKERKFAMPVQRDMTFEAVWADIEQRYKTSYLDAQQAATFSIKKLQDAYDCDLAMTDTVGDIFEGESDPRMRMIRVIPHFIYRDTSVVPGSMLRPTGAQKRRGGDVEDGANKRRRVASQQRQSTYEVHGFSPNRPIPSTESQHAVARGPEDTQVARRSTRSKTGTSLVELSHTETGQAPFSTTAIKQEEPEPQESPHLNGIEAASPSQLTRSHDERPSHDRIRTPREESQEAPLQPMEEEEGPEVEGATEDGLVAASTHQQAALQQSPISSTEPEAEFSPATRQRKDIYDVPNSPDFMHKTITPNKPGRTYGRSPKTGLNVLNSARAYNRVAENETPASAPNARATQRPLANVPPSTPQDTAILATQINSNTTGNEVDDDDPDLTTSFLDEAAAPSYPRTPARTSTVKPAKPGSLKKPSRSSLLGTPGSVKRGTVSKAAATPAMATYSSQSRLALRPSPGQSTPLKNPLQPPSNSRKRPSISSAASQSVAGSVKGKQAAVFKTPALKTSARTKSATPKSVSKSNESATEQPDVTTPDPKPTNGTFETSSAESSSESEEDEEKEPDKHSKVRVDGTQDVQASPAKKRSQRVFESKNGVNDQNVEPAEGRFQHEEAAAHLDEPPTQDKPPSGQEEHGAARWATQSWGFSRLHQTENTNPESPQHQAPGTAAAVVTPVTEDEGFSEQETYITALEDSRKVGSRSASAAASPGSSPAVSRRPARFLSHSPTPDASESEGESVEAAAAKVPSPHVSNRDDSESDSSSDSSEDDDVALPDLPAGRVAAANVQADLPSSPPLAAVPTLSPRVPHSNQSTPSQPRRPVQQTPVVPPTLQSSQAPRSSQSVSVQAVDRRRYTGFRSLREQLADTKAAQATTQSKPFDPRTMSLGKLVKNTPLAGLGGEDESSDDESSSSSSSDSD
ncbi:hypothetical protein E8E11_000718 [Didymella keratinophila]|nr:hypothetical protein E8E11_000718 [Didymella keratinophila]